ncbi:hypothetical protein B4N89_17930 [Embleya scabrispora]|uniref:Uncharacterized protein n=1 Tax=Embleya scabrispora TaxID=159449 RepID=A0A1T3P0D4_9ACTN|nr:hypothetical protein [Embleya scabrispora]OPC82567.1 hypothetical protein B4N89_17930 [Embleya scabrispora]
MRPKRFEPWLAELLRQSGAVTDVAVRTEAGEQRAPRPGPYGVSLRLRNGATIELGITAESAPGDQYVQTETEVRGEPPARVESVPAIDGAKVKVADVEEWLAALAVNSGSPELRKVSTRYSQEDPPGAIPYGVELRWHSGAKTRVNFQHAYSSGDRPGAAYQCPDII